MIKTISKISKDYETKEFFQDNIQEDVVDFMWFLLNYNACKTLMTIHETRQFLVNDISDANTFEHVQDVGDTYVVSTIYK